MTGPVFARMNSDGSSYVSLTIKSDGTATERVVRDGEVVSERELASVPEQWPG